MADLDPRPTTARIDLADEPEFELGGMQVKPAERAVFINGERRELQPRVMQVLVALAKAQPEVVSRDRLIELCWDGRIVGDDALNRCVLALRHLAQDVTPQPFSIETVPRIGHRLVVTAEGKAIAPPTGRISRWRVVAALALLLLIATGGFLVWQQRNDAPEPASIAVLPFRNLGAGDSYFAEGIGEEILGQLSGEPHFRVIGSSSSSQFGANPNMNEVARLLDVDYVLEGSVRRQGDEVRVNAGLVRTRDGIRLWSGSYDGKLDDIFAIQRQMGTAIAGALQRRLVRAPGLSGPLVTKGEAYSLYLTARALIRTNNRRVAPTAVDFLRDAIRLDPGYAPAWASLAEASRMQAALGDHENFIAANRLAREYAGRAIRLAPDLAEGHRALGETFGYGDPEGNAHLARASELGPNDAANLFALASVRDALGEFELKLAALRRAHEIDPLWYRTTGQTAIATAEMGNRVDAEAIGQRNISDKGVNLQILLGRIAWIFADYSEAARYWSTVARSNPPRWGHVAARTFHDATKAVGVSTGRLEDIPYPTSVRSDWRVWMDAPPVPAVWQQRNRDPIAAAVYRKHNLLAAKLMLNAGRAREIVAAYEGPIGVQGIRPRQRLRVDQLAEAPLVALALRAGGRAADADRLLREADSLTRAVYRRSKVPFWFDAQSAAIFAVEGRPDEALSTLERAYARGWRQNAGNDLGYIGDEPAFRSLHAEPRFKRLQKLLAEHYARERREVETLLRSQKPALNSRPS